MGSELEEAPASDAAGSWFAPEAEPVAAEPEPPAEKTSDDKSTTLSFENGGAKVAHEASKSWEAGEDKTSRSSDWAVGYADGKANATVGQKSEMQVGKDHVSSEDRATLEGKKFDATHTTSARTTDPDLAGKVVETSDRTSGLHYDKGTLKVDTAGKESTEVDGHTFSKERSMSVGSDKSFAMSSAKDHAYKDEAGSSDQKSDWGASYADGKAKATYGTSSAAKVGDESSTASSSRLTYDDGKLSAEQKKSSVEKDPDLGGKVTESKDSAVGVTYDKGKLAARSSTKEKTDVDGDSFSKERSMGVASDGSFDMSGKKSQSHKDEEGSSSKSSDYVVGFADGKANATVGSKSESKVGEEKTASTESRASYANGKLSAERTSSSVEKDPELGGKVTESKSSKTGVTYENGKAELGRSKTEKTEVDGQSFAKEKGTSIGSDGSIVRSSKSSKTYTDDQGEHTESKGTSISASRDGGSIAHEREKATKDGGSTKSSVSGGIDTKAGTANAAGSYSATSKNGTTAKASGGLTIDSHGNLVGAQGSASVGTKGGWTASVSGSYKVEAAPPRQEGDRFVVEWSRTAKGGLSAGKGGGKLAISGSAEKSERDFGTRNFKTKEDAENFRKNAASMIGGDFGSQTSVEGALAMGIGESRGVGDTSKLSGELTAHAGVAELGVGGSKSKEDAVLVERLSPTLFQITVAKKADDEKHAGLGVAGIGATGFSGSGTTKSSTVQFDLSKADGKAAFEEFQRTQVLPKKGGSLVSETDAERARHGTRMNFGPAGSAEFGSETWESTTVGKDGKKEVFGGENSESIVQNIPFFKGHDASAINIVSTLVNGKDSFYSMQGKVDSTDGDYSQKALAKITGTHTDGGDHKSSGKWRVDVNIDDGIVDRFLDKMSQHKVRDPGIAEALARPDFKNILSSMVKSAKTPEDKMRALSYFMAESGLDSHAGIDEMRGEIFGYDKGEWDLNAKVKGTFHSDLFLEKDPNKVFTGIEGRLAVEAKIHDYADLLKASDKGGGAIVGSIAGDMAELERKIKAVSDEKNYTDLPAELRQMQIGTFQQQLGSLRQLRDIAAKDGVKDMGPEEGKHDTADPKTKELRALRRQVSGVDDKIAAHKQRLAEMASRLTPKHHASDDELHGAFVGVQQGDSAKHAAQADEPSADDARAKFVTALDSPDSALVAGRACLVELARVEASYAAAEADYQPMYDFNIGY